MATRTTDNIITGNDPRLGMCFYFSPYFNQNIWRRSSTLTGERTKTDPAFEGYRKSSNRLKQASPLAGSLYKLLPKDLREFALYRTLTGEAIKMLKEGMEAVIITESLKKKYIDPILETPVKNSGSRTIKEPGKRDRVKGMNDFTSHHPIPSGVRKMTRKRRALLLQKITAGEASAEDYSSAGSDLLPALRYNSSDSPNTSTSPLSEPQLPDQPKSRNKTTDGLIYLGRLPECKKLKMWVRPLFLL